MHNEERKKVKVVFTYAGIKLVRSYTIHWCDWDMFSRYWTIEFFHKRNVANTLLYPPCGILPMSMKIIIVNGMLVSSDMSYKIDLTESTDSRISILCLVQDIGMSSSMES